MTREPVPATSIFEQPWWLDAVAPGQWQDVQVHKNEKSVARLTFVLKRRFGFTIVGKAPLTPIYGPALRITAKKKAKRISQQIALQEALIQQLPRFDYLDLNLSPQVQNWLPYHWAGFEQTTRYTYRFTDLGDPDRLWDGMRSNIRRDIRKARDQVDIRTDLGIERFLDLNEMTFKRQNQKMPYSRDLVRRLDQAAQEHDARRMFFAVDADDHIHAALYIVHDKDCAYYLMGGGDPKARNSGATSLAMWSAIQYAAQVSGAFDFEGSMLRPVERFFRAFGAQQTPYHNIRKGSPLFRAALGLRNAFSR